MNRSDPRGNTSEWLFFVNATSFIAVIAAAVGVVLMPGALVGNRVFAIGAVFLISSKLTLREILRNYNSDNQFRAFVRAALSIPAVIVSSHALAFSETAVAPFVPRTAPVSVRALASNLRVGDVIFIRVDMKPFREVAAATGSWTNHVGIVVDTASGEPVIGESTFPVTRTTTLSRFVARSENGRIAVSRLASPLTTEQVRRVTQAAHRRAWIFFDTGFNLHSRRQFCSRYVREVLNEAAGVAVGEVETFSSLLARHPQANVGFWKLWYFGRIPWDRETVTPASLLRSQEVIPVFDGLAVVDKSR